MTAMQARKGPLKRKAVPQEATKEVRVRMPAHEPPSDRRSELMRTLWGEIAPKDDWKKPIDCTVPADMESLYTQAIIFFTATVPDSLPAKQRGHVRLVAAGYRMGPAGP